MKKKRVEDWMTEYAYLVMLCCVIAIVAGCAMYTRRLNIPAAAPAQELSEAAHTAQPAQTPFVTPLPTIAPMFAVTFAPRTQWPVEGTVLRIFDAQEPVYWEALNCWRAHTGLDIAAEDGDSVVSCADAKVTHITQDALWGWQVTTAQQDGRVVRYAGLESCSVKEGARIHRGQEIGTVMASIPCEGELPAHLHLEVERNGVIQDPEAMLPLR